MTAENQRVAVTKRLLRESLLKLLRSKEIDKINVAELCREAGINRATFYRHYAIPRDVLVETERLFYEEMKNQVTPPETEADVHGALLTLCRYVHSHREIIALLIRNNSDADFMRLCREIALEIWAESARGREITEAEKQDRELQAVYHSGGSYFLLRYWALGNIESPPEEMAKALYRAFVSNAQK